jgi:chemotaxis protein methyltransferase WspC
VLIYFDRDAQDRVIASLENLLADDGMLFVGPAETGVAMRHGMQSARIPLAFAFRRARADAVAANAYAARRASMASGTPPYRRTERASVAPLAATRSVLSVAPSAWNGDGRQPFAAPLRVRGFDAPADMHADTAASADDGTAPTLEHAQALANAGAFDEAERVLAQFSARVGPHADAFYLNGLIADARGRAAEAGDYYRKALYLRPTHHEALTHLATLLDVGGDRAGAQWLLERARRSAG